MKASRLWVGLWIVACACGSSEKRASADPGASAAARSSDASDTSAASAGRGEAGQRLVFVGTSLTAGYGLDPDQSFPALIGDRIQSLGLNYQVVNAGVSGATSADTRRQMQWLVRQPIDVLVLETGANDGLRGLSVDSLRANLRAILDTVRTTHPEAQLFLVQMEAVPNLGAAYTGAFHAAFPEVARETGATLLPFLLAGVAGVDSLNQGDGIHPNARGERIVANNLWRALRPALSKVAVP